MTPTDMPGAGVTGRVVDDRIVPAGGEWSGVVPAGQVLRIVDLEGRQAVDFLCYSAADPSERYNAADTMKFAGTIFLTTGHGLYSGLGRRLFTIVADTCGRHDTIGGCCSASRIASATASRGRRTAGTTSSGPSRGSGWAGRTSSPT